MLTKKRILCQSPPRRRIIRLHGCHGSVSVKQLQKYAKLFLACPLFVFLLVPKIMASDPIMVGYQDKLSGPAQEKVEAPKNSDHDETTGKTTKWNIPDRLRVHQTDESSPREQQQAPCVPCLDEWEAIDVAKGFLDEYPIDYIGVRAEIAEGFPWRGSGIRWSRDDSEWYFGYKIGLKLESENSDFVAEHPEEHDHTWRVWYQTGWIERYEIAEVVAAGGLPAEALNWGRQPKEEFVLVHARSGSIKPARFGREEDYYGSPRRSPEWWAFKRAVSAAEDRAKMWLPDFLEPKSLDSRGKRNKRR